MTRRPIEEWQEPVLHGWGPFLLEQSRNGYGWNLTIGRRVRWSSRNATTRQWPGAYRGTDEHCNRAVTVHAWPVGSLTVWWEPHWHDEPCATCIAELTAQGARPGFCCARHLRANPPAPVPCPAPDCGALIPWTWHVAAAAWRLDVYRAPHGPEWGCTRACLVRSVMAGRHMQGRVR